MLPYQNLHQAEAALGRELTIAEKLWLNYSANKPDYLLHYHNILFLILFYSIAPLPYMFIELSRSKRIDKHKIQSKIKNSFQDMLKCYKDVVQTFIVVVGPLQVSSYPFIKVY
jgi:4,4-dimethyl-9beta,19-cyclopropylsterol-4alpha-methyl oxidase